MLFVIAAVLFVLWVLGLVSFHLTTFAVHILLVAAVIFLLIALFRGPSRTTV